MKLATPMSRAASSHHTIVALGLFFSLLLANAWILPAEVAFLPLAEVKPGLEGVGRTVFAGDNVEEFQVKILGVLHKTGPGQSIILARLSGGPIHRTGVLQGMSGSPVYVGGKLVGAVAFAFPFSTEPIAGLRPIEEILQASALPPRRLLAGLRSPLEALPEAETRSIGDFGIVELATPISFSGFTEDTLRYFAPALRRAGFNPMQTLSGGADNATPQSISAEPKPVLPGSMISVQLMRGDFHVAADGTVTHVEGNRIYAFGHRFLAAGATELPFARASVLALLPNLSTSFKISSAGEWLGSITRDTNSALVGELGRPARLVPVSIRVHGLESERSYRFEMVNDRLLSPLLLQMSLYSALDATERTLGPGSVRVMGLVQLEGASVPLRIQNLYSGDLNVPLQASLGFTTPVTYALQNSLGAARLSSVDLSVEVFEAKRQAQIDQVWTSKRIIQPGETLDIRVVLLGEGGQEIQRQLAYQIPVGAKPGTLYISVADGPSTNASELRSLSLGELRPTDQLVQFLNSLRGNLLGYVRLWRTDPAFQIQGSNLPDPPPSLSLILGRGQHGTTQLPRSSTIAELTFDAGGLAIYGSRTVQVEIKE